MIIPPAPPSSPPRLVPTHAPVESDPRSPESLRPRVVRPRGWRDHIFRRSFDLPVRRGDLWRWLNDPATFTRQMFPFRVEFVAGSGIRGGGGFEPGVLTLHHGPGLHFCGIITDVDAGLDGDGLARDLWYTYGAFALSPRLIRPVRLRFDLAEGDSPGDSTRLELLVTSHVRPFMHAPWTLAQRMFWAPFAKSATRGVRRSTRRRRHSAPDAPSR